MAKNIHTILMPFLIICYIFGLRIATSNRSILWFNVIYILLVLSVYIFFALHVFATFHMHFPVEENICHYIEIPLMFLSIVFGIYYEKKFQNCLKKFDVVDNTLLKLGTRTNYDNLRKKAIWYISGWIFIAILIIYYIGSLLQDDCDGDIASNMFYIFIRDYWFHTNLMVELTNASVLQYTGLKFDQINEHLRNLTKNQKHKITRAWGNSRIYPHQRRLSKPLSNKYITWIIIHLYLELRKISCDINLIFGAQMTIKMISYFGWITIDLRGIFNAIFIDNYTKSKLKTIISRSFCVSHHIFKFMLINYMCETVSTKASATSDLLNKLSYVTGDDEIREIISQFSLRIVYAPLRFCGIGFFQFGFKFLYKVITSIATVLVIIIQAQVNK